LKLRRAEPSWKSAKPDWNDADLFSDKDGELRKAPAPALSAQPRNGVTPQR
jgi:hypothetical protein